MVSPEPTPDVDASIEIIKQTDLYKLGRGNYLPMTEKTDWKDHTLRVIDTFAKVAARSYIKKDLQPYLPEGYDNPLRVPQHH